MTERLPTEAFMLKNMPDKSKWGWYIKNITDTRKLLDLERLPCRWAAVHANTWMHPKYLDSVLRIAFKHKDLVPDVGFEPTCMFNAFLERDYAGLKYAKMEDHDKKVI